MTFNYRKNGHLATVESILDAESGGVRQFPFGGAENKVLEPLNVFYDDNNLYISFNL